MSDQTRIAKLAEAREKRSEEKRALVEDAILRLSETKQPITFVSVAREANVSRQYLYNNFAQEIGRVRDQTRTNTGLVEGQKVPARTSDEYRHIEAALRNKIERLEHEIKKTRLEKSTADRQAEKERGKAEHWRQLYERAMCRPPVSP
ncbi:DUF6262 family protein (plasmid) [Erythrobacteraceae bacterium WH01K]|nr:DUF6262 family protein [Erythrobacteraceae bacterium WH01K]